MTYSKKGSLTIFLALTVLIFLTFCLVLAEGARIYFLRMKTMQAMELAEFSVLSEYQYELFSDYGLFFLDLDYEQGTENTGILESRGENYLLKNAEEVDSVSLTAGKFRRASDAGGMAFFEQAVEQMKVQNGYRLIQELVENVGTMKEDTLDLGEVLAENSDAAKSILSGYVDEEGEPLFEISIPSVSFPSIEALTEAVFGSENSLSEKSVNLEERISKRKLSVGVGTRESISLTEMQLFHGYLFEHCSYYGSESTKALKEVLEYQLEYIVSGKESDKENLENVMWRIFLLRAGGNYLFYHQDAEKLGEAQAQAAALVGIVGDAGLIKVVQEIILISQAIEDGIQETKRIFAGGKEPLYQSGMFSGIELGYEEYLYLFLNTTGKTQKIFRSMDIVELEVREKSGYGNLKLDRCTDCFEFVWKYQFDSLFREIPLMDGDIYENTITRKIYYER